MYRLTGDIPRRKRLKVGMIGGGEGAFFGSYHRAAMRLANRFELTAGAFSADASASRAAGEALGLHPDRNYESYSDLVAGEASREDRIDVCVVVTPNHLHFEPCKLLLEAGIPVICDKPLVNDLEEARELAKLADSTGVFFGVTYTYLGYAMVRDLRARIAAGELGDIRFLYVEYLLEWMANPAAVGKGSAWRLDPKRAGPTGALGDVGTHAFNLLEFLSGRRCTSINAKMMHWVPGYELEDTDVIQLEFDGRVDGLLWCSLAAPGHRNALRVKVVGTKGTAEWNQESPETLHVSRLDQADLIYRRAHGDMTGAGRDAVNLPPGDPEAYLEALATLYTDFADALEAGDRWRQVTAIPVPDVHEAVRGVALSTVALESSAKRGWVPFPCE